VAPPHVRWITPLEARYARSRRMVASDAPISRINSATVTCPFRKTSRTISPLRCSNIVLALLALPGGFIRRCNETPLGLQRGHARSVASPRRERTSLPPKSVLSPALDGVELLPGALHGGLRRRFQGVDGPERLDQDRLRLSGLGVEDA